MTDDLYSAWLSTDYWYSDSVDLYYKKSDGATTTDDDTTDDTTEDDTTDDSTDDTTDDTEDTDGEARGHGPLVISSFAAGDVISSPLVTPLLEVCHAK